MLFGTTAIRQNILFRLLLVESLNTRFKLYPSVQGKLQEVVFRNQILYNALKQFHEMHIL